MGLNARLLEMEIWAQRIVFAVLDGHIVSTDDGACPECGSSACICDWPPRESANPTESKEE